MVGRNLGGRDPRALRTGKAKGKGNRSDLTNLCFFFYPRNGRNAR